MADVSAARAPEFSLAALFAALDLERQSRGLTWAAVVREMNGGGVHAGRQMSASTVTATRVSRISEADGVLQMLRWLRRSLESFMQPVAPPGANHPGYLLPSPPPGLVLRFDTRKLHAALDAYRAAHGLTWTSLGHKRGMAPASLTRLSQGGRTAFPTVTRLTQLLNRPAADFVHACPS
ncbi:MAG TPA: hypothetical protein VN709_07750 [Terriglobales bacterium]|nr:hypothetical protein [Terriglobales bacterium]